MEIKRALGCGKLRQIGGHVKFVVSLLIGDSSTVETNVTETENLIRYQVFMKVTFLKSLKVSRFLAVFLDVKRMQVYGLLR